MKKFLCSIIVIVTVMTLLQLCAFADTTLNTREQLVDYLTRQAASKPAEIPFRYGTALESNISNSSWMGSVMNDAGIFSASWSYGGGKCTLKSIDYMPDHVTCSSENEVISALRNARNGSVNIRVSQSLFDKLSANNFARLHQLEGEAGIDSRSMSYYTSSRLFLYSEIKYAKNFSSVSSYSEIRSLMLSYHSRGVTSYSFHCSDALFKQMIADDFAKLHQIEGEAGFSNRQMTYSTSKNQITFSDIVYATNFTSVQTLEELKQRMQQHCLALEREFSFHCSESLYNTLVRNDFDQLHALESNYGIYLRTMTHSDSKQLVTYSSIEYYPGYHVARLVRLGRTHELRGKMLTLYNEAKSLLQSARQTAGNDPLALQFAIQGAIMSRVEYLLGDSEGDQDTAYGALLNGKSECDGYADAFYLLADLAGLEVRFQQGASLKNNENHLWNVIKHGGQWYFTDLTWCDFSPDFGHMYCNIGKDIAQGCYLWDESCTVVPLAASTSAQYYYYSLEGTYFSTPGEAASYVTRELRSGSRCVDILLRRPAGEDIAAFVDRFTDQIEVGYRTSYKYTTDLVSFLFYPRD